MALNNMGILGALIFFLLASATFIPIIQATFESSGDAVVVDQYTGAIIEEAHGLSGIQNFTPFAIVDIFINVLKLAFIGVSGLPFWMDLFYSFISVMFIMVMLNYIPQVGGGG